MEIGTLRVIILEHYKNKEGYGLCKCLTVNSNTPQTFMLRDFDKLEIVAEPWVVGDWVQYMDRPNPAQIKYLHPDGKRAHIMGEGIDTWAQLKQCRKVPDGDPSKN